MSVMNQVLKGLKDCTLKSRHGHHLVFQVGDRQGSVRVAVALNDELPSAGADAIDVAVRHVHVHGEHHVVLRALLDLADDLGGDLQHVRQRTGMRRPPIQAQLEPLLHVVLIVVVDL